jgi:hypothetical protein
VLVSYQNYNYFLQKKILLIPQHTVYGVLIIKEGIYSNVEILQFECPPPHVHGGEMKSIDPSSVAPTDINNSNI